MGMIKTREGSSEYCRGSSKVKMHVNLDGDGKASVVNMSGFIGHMLQATAKLASIDLEAEGFGGLHSEYCLGMALGQAIDLALEDHAGINRYGWATVPMDEAFAQVALDLSGRPYLVLKGEYAGERIGDLDTSRIASFLEGLTVGGRITLNVRFEGENDHHKAESVFKALGLALFQAISRGRNGVLSTKGVI